MRASAGRPALGFSGRPRARTRPVGDLMAAPRAQSSSGDEPAAWLAKNRSSSACARADEASRAGSIPGERSELGAGSNGGGKETAFALSHIAISFAFHLRARSFGIEPFSATSQAALDARLVSPWMQPGDMPGARHVLVARSPSPAEQPLRPP